MALGEINPDWLIQTILFSSITFMVRHHVEMISEFRSFETISESTLLLLLFYNFLTECLSGYYNWFWYCPSRKLGQLINNSVMHNSEIQAIIPDPKTNLFEGYQVTFVFNVHFQMISLNHMTPRMWYLCKEISLFSYVNKYTSIGATDRKLLHLILHGLSCVPYCVFNCVNVRMIKWSEDNPSFKLCTGEHLSSPIFRCTSAYWQISL